MDQVFTILLIATGVLLLSAVLATSIYLLYLLQAVWRKLLHRWLTHALLVNSALIAVLLMVLGYHVTLLARLPTSIYYTVGLLALFQIYLILFLDSYVLQTFSILVSAITAKRMETWRMTLSFLFAICFLPSIIQYYYAFALADPVNDTPYLVQKATSVGVTVLGSLTAAMSAVQSFCLVSIIYNWTRSRMTQVSPLAKQMYTKAIYLGVVIAGFDLIATFAQVFVSVIEVPLENAAMLDVIMQFFSIFFLLFHANVMVYQFQILKSIAVEGITAAEVHSEIELPATGKLITPTSGSPSPNAKPLITPGSPNDNPTVILEKTELLSKNTS